MKHQGGALFYGAVLSIVAARILTCGFIVQAIDIGDLVISKVQITGGTGKTSEDYITIYNKTSSPIDLNGLRLVKRTKTGTTDTTIKSWINSTLLNPGNFYTWANSTNNFATLINADCSSTQTISDDNGIAIIIGAENTGQIIDSFAWGSANNIFAETLPFPINHVGSEYYERINNQDTNNNSLDFHIISSVIKPICGNNFLE